MDTFQPVALRSSAAGVQPADAGRGGPIAGPAAAARIVIQYPSPSVGNGRYPAKRCVGDTVRVEADVFRDGHDLLRAVVRHRAPGGDWEESEMERIDAPLGVLGCTDRAAKMLLSEGKYDAILDSSGDCPNFNGYFAR